MLWCVLLLSWASLSCFDTETRAKCLDFFFFFSSPLGSPCGLTALSCPVLLPATGARIEVGSSGGGEGGQRLPSEGLPNPPKALLERLPRPPKELERLKGSAKCQTGISKKGGLASSAHPNTNPFHSAFLLQASCGCFSAAALTLYLVVLQ